MRKNLVQDVVAPKKSIRNIKLSDRPRHLDEVPKNTSRQPKKELTEEDFIRKVPMNQSPMRIEPTGPINTPPPSIPTNLSYKYEYDEPGKYSKKWLYVASGLFIIAVAFGVSALFKSAEIKVSPKQETKALNDTFTAKKDSTSGLAFQVVTVSKDIDRTITATEEQKVDKKATGKIIIYNNYSTASQKLVATTRFQTPEGLIYRLISPATIPGKQTKDGKSIAGSVEVTVEADKAGISYNIGLKDFTIPGFKGDPKYTSIYARSKTEMTGGFSGIQKVVSADVMAKMEKDLEAELRSSLMKDITAQIPANFILYDTNLVYQFDPVSQVYGSSVPGSATTTLRKKGKASGIIFDRVALTKAISNRLLPKDVDSIKIANLEKLTFNTEKTIDFNNDNELSFNLSGNVDFVWVFDENQLKTSLLGISKKNAKNIIAQYSGIKEAWIETSPFWNTTIPEDSKKVTIINTFK